jgi:uncharacterized membrane protein YdjX (TVP38/TMEM64 family)
VKKKDILHCLLFHREILSAMTSKHWAIPRVILWLRVAATIGAWILLVVYVHRVAHLYGPEIHEVLASPASQIAATTVLLTSLVYFVVLSLPFVPSLGLRSVGIVLVWAALLVAGHSLSHMGFHDAQAMLSTMRDAAGVLALVSLALAYGVALAMPFIPGVELGLLIMAVFGPVGALVAYAGTIGGLSLAYAVGQVLPERVVARLLATIGIAMPRDGVTSAMQDMIAESRLTRSAPRRLAAVLLDHRYLTLAVCLNFPGNAALGGGGGLALLCGMSKQFGWRSFFLTVAIATSPVPILVLAGLLNLEPLMEHHGFVHDLLSRIERLFIHN